MTVRLSRYTVIYTVYLTFNVAYFIDSQLTLTHESLHHFSVVTNFYITSSISNHRRFTVTSCQCVYQTGLKRELNCDFNDAKYKGRMTPRRLFYVV